ncbi:hypothetical protein QTN47_14470 [Danxiaibacter flavus]|uniref:Uncharacterized protein n=1 Tax=Danxiaibacter flavus TaxID=3049108 RepID=A0ABV3ZFY6_9BACT|nr:hypothetical protein QNM32_14475 [Chitinophagaceae bacterium DXS]
MKKNVSSTTSLHHYDVGNEINGHFYWVGHCSNGIHYSAGQTFNIKQPGRLRAIKLFSEMVTAHTDASITLFEFDERNHVWQKPLLEKHVKVDHSTDGQWLEFNMDGIVLDAHRQYGFKISCNNGGMIAIGEGSWTEKDPYPDGEEWTGSSENASGSFYRNHDLTFLATIEGR